MSNKRISIFLTQHERQDGDSRGQSVLKKNATTKLQSTVRSVILEVKIIIGCVQYMQNNTNKRLWMS
jgi:hypothetical protein